MWYLWGDMSVIRKGTEIGEEKSVGRWLGSRIERE